MTGLLWTGNQQGKGFLVVNGFGRGSGVIHCRLPTGLQGDAAGCVWSRFPQSTVPQHCILPPTLLSQPGLTPSQALASSTLQISTLFAASSISSLRASALAPDGCRLLDSPEDFADCCHL